MGCVAGAMTDTEYRQKLGAAGFTEIELETTRIYDIEDAPTFLAGSGLDVDGIAPLVTGKVTSAFVEHGNLKAAAARRVVQ